MTQGAYQKLLACSWDGDAYCTIIIIYILFFSFFLGAQMEKNKSIAEQGEQSRAIYFYSILFYYNFYIVFFSYKFSFKFFFEKNLCLAY